MQKIITIAMVLLLFSCKTVKDTNTTVSSNDTTQKAVHQVVDKDSSSTKESTDDSTYVENNITPEQHIEISPCDTLGNLFDFVLHLGNTTIHTDSTKQKLLIDQKADTTTNIDHSVNNKLEVFQKQWHSERDSLNTVIHNQQSEIHTLKQRGWWSWWSFALGFASAVGLFLIFKYVL